MVWGKAKEKEIVYIYIVKHIFFYRTNRIALGKALFPIYIRKTYTTIWAKYIRKRASIVKLPLNV